MPYGWPKDGEVIDIQPGNYLKSTGDMDPKYNLIIRGVGERPVMLADGKSAEGKAIWVVRGGRQRADRECRVPRGTGSVAEWRRYPL